MRTRLSDYTRTEKTIASLLIVVLSLFSLQATFANNNPFTRYSDILKSRGIIVSDYDSISRYAKRVDTLSIAVGLGGWPTGCSASATAGCDIESIARSRGLVPPGFDNVNLGIVIRANAIRLSLQSRGIGPSLAPSGFRDVDGKLSIGYAGYISKAREIGCIQTAELFRPFDPVTEGEYAKMAVCSLEDSEESLSAAPSQIAGQYGAVPLSNVFIPSTPSGGSFPSGGNGNYALKSELEALRTLVYALSGGVSHLPVSLSTANGLSLSGQVLSLGLASATTTGALTPSDWSAFYSKEYPLAFTLGLTRIGNTVSLVTGIDGQVLAMSGGLPTWVAPGAATAPVTSVFGRLGAITAQSGDYTTMLVTESGSNLYFTDARAQDALSGTIAGINSNISSLSSSLTALTNNYNTLATTVNTLSGQTAANTADINTLSGGLEVLSSSINTLSGNLASLNSTVSALSATTLNNTNAINTLSGTVATMESTLSTLSGSVATLTTSVSTLTSDVSTLSGQTATNSSNITSLSGTLATTNATLLQNTANLATLSGSLATLSGAVSTLQSQMATLGSQAHAAVTLGAANGLSLSGQELSLLLASTSTTGALSATDWNNFNSKISLTSLSASGPIGYDNTSGVITLIPGIDGQILSMSGGVATWVAPGAATAPVSSVFGRLGAITAQSGDYDTTLVTESGSNLYFTDVRAQNALSGSITTLASQVASLAGQSHAAVTLATANGLSLSGQELSLGLASATTTGSLSITDYNAFSSAGSQSALNTTDIASLSGMLATLSGSLSTTNTNLATLSGQTATNTANIAQNTSDISTFSGTLASKISLSNLSATGGVSYNNLTGQFGDLFSFNSGLSRVGNTIGITTGTDGQILAMSGGVVTWVAPGATSPVSSVFGRFGAITAQSGDYTTTQVTEGTNLYFTDTRAQNALSGTIAGINSNISSLSGNLASLSSAISTLSGVVATNSADISTLSGGLASTNSNLSSLSGVVSDLSTTVSTLSGSLSILQSSVSTLSGVVVTNTSNLASLSGTVASLSTTVSTLSGVVDGIVANITSLSGALATTNGNLATLSGQTATNTANISSLSGSLATLSGAVSTLQSQIASLGAQAHDAVTIGVGNGLSLSGQQISLLLASATTTGALSAVDWATFSAKENALTFNNGLSRVGNTIGLTNGTNGQILSMVGGVPTWVAPASVSVPVDTVFGRTGDILPVVGDYNTMLVTESGSNLYFTEIRAQNALSGTVATLSGQIATNTSSIATLSGLLSIANTNIATLSGNLATTNTNLTNLSGTVNTLSGRVTTLSGTVDTVITNLNTTNANLATATGNIATLSGQTATNTSNISTLSGQVATLASDAALISASLSTLSGTVAQNTSNIATLSGQIATNTSDITTLSGALASLASSAGSLSGSLAALATTVDTLSGQTATNTSTISTLSGSLATLTTTVNILSGSLANLTTVVDTLSGQIQANTANIATNTADITSLSGALVTLNNTVNSLSGTVSTLSSSVDSLSGGLATTNSNLSTLSGSLGTTNTNLASLSGTVSTLTTTVDTLSGQVATLMSKMHDAVTLGTANGLSLSGQELSLALASATTTGGLSAMDFAAFSGKQNALTLTTLGNNGASTWTPGTSTLNVPTYTLGGLGGISLTSLSGSNGVGYNNTTGQFTDLFTFNNGLSRVGNTIGLANGSNGEVLTMVGGVPTWATSASSPVTSVFGRTGSILAVSGDYDTSLVTESGSLYFTNARAIGSLLTGFVAGSGTVTSSDSILQALQKLQGSNTIQDSMITTLSGLTHSPVTLGTANGLSLAGQQISLGLASTSTAGALSSADWNTFNNKVGFISGTANGLSISGTGISLGLASSTTTGALSIADYASFSGKLSLTSLLTGFAASSGSVTSADSVLSALQKLQGTKIALTSLSATGGLTYNNLTGVFGDAFTFNNGLTRVGNTVGLTLGSTGQYLTMSGGTAIWASLAGGTGLSSLNGMTGATQTFAIGTGGTDFNIVSAGNIHTFNLPDASGTARGLVNTGTQTFTGAKTFDSPVTINSQQTGTGGLRFTQISSTSTGIAGNGKVLTLDGSGNVVVANMAYGAELIASKSTALTAAMSNTAQVVVFNNETQDSNSAYNNTTGVFTTPTLGADTYTIEAQLGFTIPNLNIRTPCIAIRRAGTVISSACNSDYNDTAGGTTGSRKSVATSATITLTAGQTVDVVTYTDTNPTAGTVPTFEAVATTNYFVIKRTGNAPLIASDERLKKDIATFTGGLSDIRSLRTVSYEYNGKSKNALNDGRKHVGILAQEVQSGSLGKWAISTGPDGFLRYDPNAVIYSLVNSVKEIDKRTQYAYFDDTTEAEYGDFTASGENAFDRFTFMVKKSLEKIDPNLVYTDSGSESPAQQVDLTPLQTEMQALSGKIAETQAQIASLQSIQSPTITGATLPEEDVTALSFIRGATEALFIEFRTVFTDLVTFTRAVVFESIVTFKDRVFFEARVVFSDPDMAGTAIISTGGERVRVDFETPYSIQPIVTISPVGHYSQGTVKNLTTTGFEIEVSSTASSPLKFNWIALLVTSARDTSSTAPEPVVPPSELIESVTSPYESVDPEVSSGSGSPADISTGSTTPEESPNPEEGVEGTASGTTTETNTGTSTQEVPLVETPVDPSPEPVTETPPVTTPPETVSGEV